MVNLQRDPTLSQRIHLAKESAFLGDEGRLTSKRMPSPSQTWSPQSLFRRPPSLSASILRHVSTLADLSWWFCPDSFVTIVLTLHFCLDNFVPTILFWRFCLENYVRVILILHFVLTILFLHFCFSNFVSTIMFAQPPVSPPGPATAVPPAPPPPDRQWHPPPVSTPPLHCTHHRQLIRGDIPLTPLLPRPARLTRRGVGQWKVNIHEKGKRGLSVMTITNIFTQQLFTL